MCILLLFAYYSTETKLYFLELKLKLKCLVWWTTTQKYDDHGIIVVCLMTIIMGPPSSLYRICITMGSWPCCGDRYTYILSYETSYFTLELVVPQTYNSHTVYIIPTPVVVCTTSEPVCSLPSWLTYLSDLLPTAPRRLAPLSRPTQ